jgi:hypothetical protein
LLTISIVDVVALQCGEHHPMEYIWGFTKSHWMPSLGECLHHIARAAAMIDDFGGKHKNTNKKRLAS